MYGLWFLHPHLHSSWQVTILLGDFAVTGLLVLCPIQLFEPSTADRIVHTELDEGRVRREIR